MRQTHGAAWYAASKFVANLPSEAIRLLRLSPIVASRGLK
jgi:hypothetical protein